ncbi:MAG TPA: GAF domain-containing protein [Longimicrobiaceae bacterium]|nr:GAF domain-containing protein [Longimicrobiaceae bacterium]
MEGTYQGAATRFRALIENDGLTEAIRFLNRSCRHRFTAVFRFDGGTLRNVCLVDRDDPGADSFPDQAVIDSYCVFVRDSRTTFTTENAPADERVAGHPKQHTVRSYCGIPLMGEDGSLVGTICHFDYDAVTFTEADANLLDYAAPLIVRAVATAV